jgi:hypothetical protein
MSVYSGFATRQQENFYDKLLEKVVFVLAEKILMFYQGSTQLLIQLLIELGDDRLFAKKIYKIYRAMTYLE